MYSKKKVAAGGVALLFAGMASFAHAGLITELVFKLSDSSTGADYLNAETGWTGAGGFNEGNAAAQLLVDNGLDYKNSLVDSWPTNLTNVRVSMYADGNEVAFLDFDPTGTTKNNFFAPGNVTSSSWTDINSGSYNYFSIPGHSGIDRNWFINRSYGGCPFDFGYFVVVDGDGSQPCNWENTQLGGNGRAFLYSPQSSFIDWDDDPGVADVFAVSVTRRVQDGPKVPAPATIGLFALGLLGLRLRRRA